MKQFFPALIAGVCIAAGGAGGYFLKSGSAAPAASAADGHEAPKPSHGEDKGGSHDEKKAEKKDSHGGDAGHGASTATTEYAYYKFSREFVVPMIQDDRVKSLVIFNLNLEVEPSVSQELFSKEPVVRDNIMSTLIKLSNDGKTFQSLSNVENYETMRSMVLKNLQTEVAAGIHNVLILDMARQDL